MHYFRDLNKSYLISYLIVLGMLLRTFVAAGYMLDTQTSDGDLITIKICHGLNNTIQPPSFDQSNNNKPHPDEDSELTTCNLWSSSGTSLALQLFNPDYQSDFFNRQIILYKNILLFSNLTLNVLIHYQIYPCPLKCT